MKETCLITGATSGIGKASALALAGLNYPLILIGRNPGKTSAVAEELRRKTGNGQISYFVCDLSLLESVRETARKIRSAHESLGVLINNAGARFLKHQVTGEGIEITLATNHLGHFLLTLSLIGLLEKSVPSTIINVSSGAHFAAGGLIRNVTSAGNYDGSRQYADSKLANILFTYALAAKLKDRRISVNAVAPGGVATNFGRNDGLVPWLKHRLYYLAKRRLLTPAQGAETIVYLASESQVRTATGKYFRMKKELGSSALSYDKDLQRQLWEMSVGLTGVDI